MAQLRYDLAQKEELLRLYARDAKEREGEAGVEGGNQEWVHVLTEECRELRESNLQLRQEVDNLSLRCGCNDALCTLIVVLVAEAGGSQVYPSSVDVMMLGLQS